MVLFKNLMDILLNIDFGCNHSYISNTNNINKSYNNTASEIVCTD